MPLLKMMSMFQKTKGEEKSTAITTARRTMVEENNNHNNWIQQSQENNNNHSTAHSKKNKNKKKSAKGINLDSTTLEQEQNNPQEHQQDDQKLNQQHQHNHHNHNNNSQNNINQNEEEEEQIGCRICLEECENDYLGSIGNYCNCKGSISMLHINCLQLQLQMKYKDYMKQEKEFHSKCELCSTDYRLNISKKISFYSVQYFYKKVSSKTKILFFLLFVSILSLHTSYLLNLQIKDYLVFEKNNKNNNNNNFNQNQYGVGQEQGSGSGDIQFNNTYFDINYLINESSNNFKQYQDKVKSDQYESQPQQQQQQQQQSPEQSQQQQQQQEKQEQQDYRDNVQVTLGYMLTGFFFTTGFLCFMMFTYNILSFFLYQDIYISKKPFNQSNNNNNNNKITMK